MKLVFDIGGMSTKVGFVDENYSIIKRDKISYDDSTIKWDQLKNKLTDYISKTIANQKIDQICLSCPGAVNFDEGIVIGNSAILGLPNQNVKKYFEDLFNIPTYIENDANCAAIAEVELGKARNTKATLFCVIGTGVGGAITIDNKIYRGSNYFAAEYGTMYEGELPDFLKGSDLPIDFTCTSFYGLYFTCLKYKMLTGKTITGIELFDKYNEDQNAKKVVDEMIFGLAKTIANVSLVIDPEKVIIGGAISENNFFLNLLNSQTQNLYKNRMDAKGNFTIESSDFHNDANILGAALLKK